MPDKNTRLVKIRQLLKANQAILLTKPSDVLYYSGFSSLVANEREAIFLVTLKHATLFYNSFSPIKKSKSLDLKPGLHLSVLEKNISESLIQDHIIEVLVDFSATFVSEMKMLEKNGVTVKMLDTNHIWQQKMIKDELELRNIRLAARIAKKSFKNISGKIKVGMTEIDLKNILEEEMAKLGSITPAFPTIVAFGPNSALPHHQPTTKKLSDEMPILIDFGATVAGYKSDMTRSFWFGKNETKSYHDKKKLVMNAYRAGIATASKGLNKPVCHIDKAVRDVIVKAGFGVNFCHTTGHGIGLEVHEQPSINWKNELPLQKDMVFTIEPGIYFNGKFGIRHENTVHFNGAKVAQLTA